MSLNRVPADVFALHLKTENFHRHMSGPNFRDRHLMPDEQGAEPLAVTTPPAERVRKVGAEAVVGAGGRERRGPPE